MEYNREEIKKTGIMLEQKKHELSDDEMESISGGFGETNPGLPTKGLEIVCPICNAKKTECFEPTVKYDTVQNAVQYTCRKCGPFIVVDGYAITMQNWKLWCEKNQYDPG